MTVKATIVVSFGEGVDGSGSFVLARLDDELNVDRDGNVISSFEPGDQVFLIIQHDDTVRISKVVATHGVIEQLPDKDYGFVDRVLFADAGKEGSLTAIPRGMVSRSPFGRQSTVMVAGRKVWIEAGEPVMYDLTYSARVKSYKLHTPSMALGADDEYPIAIVIYMEAA